MGHLKRGFLAVLCTAALLWPAIAAHAETVSATITGGSVSVAASSVSFSNTALNGANQTISASPASAWSAIDARGTGAAWSVTIAATTPTSAAGSVETSARTIAVSNLSASTGSLTAGTGSDATTNLTGASSLALSTSAQTLLSSTGDSKGTYTFTPTLSFQVPANAYRSNYSGAVGSSSLNPYTSTITITIA